MNLVDTDPEQIQARLCGILEPHLEILEAYVFGSVSRGTAQPHSDLDVAVFVDEARIDERGFGFHAALTTDIMAGLGTNAVDVVILNHATPLLYHRVLRDGIRLLARDLRATTTREAQALSRYFDFIPQLDKIDAAATAAPSSMVSDP